MDLSTMESLFEQELMDLYSAEKQIIEALPDMIDAAKDEELKDGLREHLSVTMAQFERLQDVLREMGINPGSKVCKGMQGLLEEVSEIVKADGDPAVKDAALIGAAQRVEHYEIAAYGTVRQFARDLGYEDIANILDVTLHEEGDADKELSKLAMGTKFESGINEMAVENGGGQA